jgi:hypothetical protein
MDLFMIIPLIISFLAGIVGAYTFIYKLYTYYQTQRRAIDRKNKLVDFVFDKREDARLLRTGFRKTKFTLRKGIRKIPRK